jgi:hypothetical protein
MIILSQIFGAVAMIALFLGYQQKKRKNLIFFKLIADVGWVVHYCLLGGYGGAIPNFVGIFRELIFVRRGKSKWASHIIWLPIFLLINLTLGIFTFSSVFNVIPIISSAFVTVSLWMKNPKHIKLLILPANVGFLVYNSILLSYVGIVNEALGIVSILTFLIFGGKTMKKIFSDDAFTNLPLLTAEGKPIVEKSATLCYKQAPNEDFANDIENGFLADFEKPTDKMAHVSTFVVVGDTVYTTYYANTVTADENPLNQTARLVYAPTSNLEDKTFLDIQAIGDVLGGKKVEMVYDTILMQKDDETIFILWTARTENNYYRFYQPFNVKTKTLGEIGVNRFKVNDVINDFSASGIKNALEANDIPCKKTYSDIGIMQKLSKRVENGETYYYSGTYSGDFTAIIKSKDLITWEYVSQPDFINDSKWENATYVLRDKVYYFVRQQDTNKCGFLTAYDLIHKRWETPIEIEDCQSRSDFIEYNGELYLFHAPIDREHIGIVKINKSNLADSEILLQAKMDTSCFYPFIQYYKDGELAMSYTVARKHIRLASFTLKAFL